MNFRGAAIYAHSPCAAPENPGIRRTRYGFAITPQAIRAPALPAGSLFMSSAFAWITSAVPPLLKIEWLSSPIVTPGATTVAFAVPLRPHREIRHVAGVRAFRILQAVMLHVRIEVAAGRCERRAFALRHRVHVNGVLARGRFIRLRRMFTPFGAGVSTAVPTLFPCPSLISTLTPALFCAAAENAHEITSDPAIARMFCSRIVRSIPQSASTPHRKCTSPESI